jgi:hypothetical protein
MAPTNNQLLERLEQLEGRCSLLETTLATITNNMVTFDTLAARLVGNADIKKVRKPRTKRVLTPEEKAAFRARMVAGKLAKEKARNASKK